jgi:peptide/nickel transport system permease protein
MQPSIPASSTAELGLEASTPLAASGRGGTRPWLRRVRPSARIGLAIVLLCLLVAIFAPLIAPHDPVEIFSGQLRKPPSLRFLMGTDEVGRDILSRVIYGSRVSMRVGLISVGIAAVCGTLLGLVAGYAGGWIDAVIMRVVDVLLAFPGILLAIAIVAVLGPGIDNVMIAVGIEAIPAYVRTVRASTLSVREHEFVLAARASGAPAGRIVLRHILPNVLAPIVVLATLGVGLAILTAAGLSFIGIGAQPPTPEWGSMLATARTYVREAPWIAASPGLAIVVLVLALNLLGDGLREALDPRLASVT